jgi:hypothetical protein
VSTQDLLPSLFAGLRENTFEDILVASSDGVVYYQFAGIGPKINNLDGLLAGTGSPTPDKNSITSWFTGLLSRSESTSDAPATLTIALRDALSRANKDRVKDATSFSDLLKVQLGGEEYIVILQPVSIDAAVVERQRSSPISLVLVGLIKSRQLDAETSTWPSSVVSWVALSLVLAYSLIFSLSSVPMKPRLQPIHRRHIALMVFCGLTSCAGLTLAVTHGYFVLFENDKDMRENLVVLGARIDENVQDELCRFHHVLRGMTDSEELARALKDYKPNAQSVSGTKPGRPPQIFRDLLASQNASSPISAIAYSYPFFDQVSWSTSDTGDQIAKWSIHKDVTPRTTMTQFPWFQEATKGTLFRLRASSKNRSQIEHDGSTYGLIQRDRRAEQQRLLMGEAIQELYVEPLISPNTGEYLTVLTKPFEKPGQKKFVGFLIVPLSSVNSPIFPPNYGFSVIRTDGTVLFSSNPDRNLRENFFRQCGWNEQLVQACQARRSRTLSATYAGTDVLMHLRPMATLDKADWTVVTYRERTEDQRSEVDIFSQTMEFMFPHVLLMLCVALTVRSIVARRSARALWPNRSRGRKYFGLICILVLIFAFHWLVALTDSRTLVFVEILLLSPFAVFLAALFLLGRSRLAAGLSCVYPSIALLHLGIQTHVGRSGTREVQHDAYLLFLGVLICLCTLVFMKDPRSSQRTLGGVLLARLRSAIASLLQGLSSTSRNTGDHSNAAGEQEFERAGDSRASSVHTVDEPEAQYSRPARGLAIWLYSLCVCIGAMLLSVVPTIACYRVAFEMVNAARAMEDLVKVNQLLENRERIVKRYYADISLPATPDEQDRFVRDRLSLENDRYDLALPSRVEGRVEFPPDDGKPPLIDRAVLRIPFLHIVTPASLWESGGDAINSNGIRDRFFLLCRPPFVQLSYRVNAPAGPASVSSIGRHSMWDYRSIAMSVRSLNPAATALWISALIIGIFVFFGTLRLINVLFFLNFRPPEKLRKMTLAEVSEVKTNTILLGAGHPINISSFDQNKVQYVDARHLEDVRVVSGQPASNKIAVLGNFDLSSDSEEMAERKLGLLEDLLFSVHQRVVLIANIDPVEYFAEVLSDESTQRSRLKEFFRNTEQRWDRVFSSFEHRRMPTKFGDGEPERSLARRIYVSCTDSQRAVLYQIAESGWVNPNNRSALAALRRRGWVKLAPMPIFDEDLATLGDHSPELISSLMSTEETRRWDSAQVGASRWTPAITIIAVVLVAGFLIAGKDLFRSIPAMITGLLAVGPTLWKAVSQFSRASVLTAKDTIDV